jgi:DNA-binding HxlR family transcriptional regulator
MDFPTEHGFMSASKKEPERRSPCPVACGLDLFGDRWTLLVIRDLLFGAERFKDFTAAPEGIPTNLLADRLNRLREHGIVTQVAAADGSRHPAYRLTAKGLALRPVLEAMRDWGLKWEKGTRLMKRAAP